MGLINTIKAKKVESDPQDVARLNELIQNFSPPRANTMISSVVQRVVMNKDGTGGLVHLYTGSKVDSFVDLSEVSLGGHGVIPQPGDRIQIFYINDNASSFAAGAQTRSWSALERAYKELQPVSGVILHSAKKRSGFIVGILPYGARAFLSLSKANLSLIETRGQSAIFMFRIIKMDSRSLHIAVSMGENDSA